MSIGTICYPAMSKPEPEKTGSTISKSSDFDSRDIVICCLSGALVLVVVALIVVILSRQQVNYGMVGTF
jgi:hypothetical protein